MTCRVVIATFEGFQPLDVVGPHEVFVGASRAAAGTGGAVPYRVLVGSLDGTPPTAESGLALATTRLPRPASITAADLLLVPGGDGVDQALRDADLLAWLRAAARRAGRVASVCSGALLLAEAGLLDCRRGTTHWTRLDQLAAAYPRVLVDRDALHTTDGTVWTSAGVTAGIDLSLAVVEADHGSQLAQTIARHLVMFLRRPGGQSQFAAPVWQPGSDHALIRSATELVGADLAADLSVARIAAGCGTSTRHLTRLFRRHLGVTPARYVEHRRMELARSLIETDPRLPLVRLAQRCGFGTTETLRRVFLRHVGVPPDDYRHRFTTSPPLPDPATV